MRLREIREDRDIKQSALAKYLNIRQSTYSQYETGNRQLPIEALKSLAIYFNTSTDYILELTDIKKPYPRKQQ
ncbi:MAG: helix-turn-helix transcriptional regulator [Eubacteriaceae bacterium]|jgi:transcriptional regulator with XRE-family HTH domain|nr:helix-turn-helix transcriptional regulator [Eubacteriaceae bacterium]